MVNKRLLDLAKRQMNPSLPRERKTPRIKRKSNLTQILERDENGKPKLNLTPMERTAVHTPTQEDFNELIRVYECGSWGWFDTKELPTKRYFLWKKYKEEACIQSGVVFHSGQKEKFEYSSREFYQRDNWKILSTQEFYEKQNPKITSDILKEINKWFSKNGK